MMVEIGVPLFTRAVSCAIGSVAPLVIAPLSTPPKLAACEAFVVVVGADFDP